MYTGARPLKKKRNQNKETRKNSAKYKSSGH